MKLLYSFLAVVLLLGSAHAALQGPTLDATLLRYDPVPVEPGDTVDVWIQLENTGDTTAENVLLAVDGSYPFSPVSEADSQVSVGTLAARGEYVTRVRIVVDRNAPQGSFALPITVSTNGRAALTDELVIEVESGAASLGVVSAVAEPREFIPGSEGTLSITVMNMEESLLRDLTVQLGLDESTFAPVSGTNEQKISRLNGGQQYSFRFDLLTEPDAASSVYRIPVNLSYTTNNGTRLSQQQTIGLIVRAQPELTVVVDEATVYEDTPDGTVLLRLINKGLSEVKFVEVTLESGENFTVSNNQRINYVGNIDSDDFETVEFSVDASEETFSLPLRISYRDALNNEYEQNISVPIMTDEKPKEGPSALVYLLLAIIVIGGLLWWRSSRPKKR